VGQAQLAARQHRRVAFHDMRLTTDVCVEMWAQTAQLSRLQWRGTCEERRFSSTNMVLKMFLRYHAGTWPSVPRAGIVTLRNPKSTVLHHRLEFFQPTQLVGFEKVFVLFRVGAGSFAAGISIRAPLALALAQRVSGDFRGVLVAAQKVIRFAMFAMKTFAFRSSPLGGMSDA